MGARAGVTWKLQTAMLFVVSPCQSCMRCCPHPWQTWPRRRRSPHSTPHTHANIAPHADEHYIPTLLAVLGLENETYCDGWGVAYTDWSAGGMHPKSFK